MSIVAVRDRVSTATRRRARLALPGIAAFTAVLIAPGCGGGSKTPPTSSTRTLPSASAPAWRPGTPQPDLTAAQIAEAGHGLTENSAFLGSTDEVLGSLGSGANVNASSNTLNADAERMGRCIAEQIGIHDASHEITLIIAYDQRDPAALQAIGKATGTCVGLKVTHDSGYQQSLATNP